AGGAVPDAVAERPDHPAQDRAAGELLVDHQNQRAPGGGAQTDIVGHRASGRPTGRRWALSTKRAVTGTGAIWGGNAGRAVRKTTGPRLSTWGSGDVLRSSVTMGDGRSERRTGGGCFACPGRDSNPDGVAPKR